MVDEDGRHQAVSQRDQVYAPIIPALGAAAGQLAEGSAAHRRLVLAQEFLMFVQEAFGTILDGWEDRTRELGPD